MSKEKEKVELRTVDDDEAEDENVRFVRLNEDSEEEIVEERAFRIGGKEVPEARLGGASRDEMKIRSNDPDVGKLIEKSDEVQAEGLEEEWASGRAKGRNVPKGWIWLVAAVFLGALIWSLVQVSSSEERQVVIEGEMEVIRVTEVEEELDAVRTVEAIEEAVRNFYDSRSIDEMLEYVRHPERVRPLMEDYYGRNSMKAKRLREFSALQPITLQNSGNFYVMKLKFDSSESTQLLIEVRDSNEAKVDWETLVCYQPMDWDEFVSARPADYTGEFRVYAKRDHFYAHEYSDSQKYACYQLTALGSDLWIFGYVERTSKEFEMMEEALKSDAGAKEPMILKLHLPGELVSRHGVVIQKMVQPLWIHVESPKLEEK